MTPPQRQQVPTATAPRDEPSPLVRYTATGCRHESYSYDSYDSFRYRGRQCGCFGGKTYCQPALDMCFAQGEWRANGTETVRSDTRQHCRCVASRWACEKRKQLIILLEQHTVLHVWFKPGSSAVPKDMMKILAAVAAGHAERPDKEIILEGHADKSEPNPSQLAQQRVQGVRKKLIEMGVDPDVMVVRSFGAEAAQEPTGPEGTWLRNAWVVIRGIGEE